MPQIHIHMLNICVILIYHDALTMTPANLKSKHVFDSVYQLMHRLYEKWTIKYVVRSNTILEKEKKIHIVVHQQVFLPIQFQ